jgi:DNA invertase Pin-like site-specific DNA recombinase
MPRTTHVLDEFRDRLRERLAELDAERKEIEQVLGMGGKARPGRRPGRPRGSGAKAATSSGAGAPRRRKRRKGTRADQAVQLVESRPGITASEIAKTMKIKPNYLYRVLGELEKEGRVSKKGRQYHAGK